MEITLPSLTPDCASCAALCCVALAFDKGDDFAIDKPAGLPCPNLQNYQCQIHAGLTEQGFPGCARYSCLGAGQRTTAMYNGIDWQSHPETAQDMFDCFADMRKIHRWIELLSTAGGLPLSPAQERTRRDLLSALCDGDMTPAKAATLADQTMAGRVQSLLMGLREYASHLASGTTSPYI